MLNLDLHTGRQYSVLLQQQTSRQVAAHSRQYTLNAVAKYFMSSSSQISKSFRVSGDNTSNRMGCKICPLQRKSDELLWPTIIQLRKDTQICNMYQTSLAFLSILRRKEPSTTLNSIECCQGSILPGLVVRQANPLRPNSVCYGSKN